MSNKTFTLSDSLYGYLLSVSLREAEVQRRLRDETARVPMAQMQIAPEQGQFMALLTRMLGARKCLEVGVFTGYSSLCVALALPPDGRIVACDINPDWTSVARRFWTDAGVAHKIDLRLAPAVETLDGLIAQGESGTFDFAFIDANKEGYWDYFERALQLLRKGGLICVDNTLWDGRVADPGNHDATTELMREFNQRVYRDQRVDLSLVPIGDGLTLALKR